MMTRKAFRAIAEILGKSLNDSELERNFTEYLSGQNSAFDKIKFSKAIQRARESETARRLTETANGIRR
jgi:hypothetical protein